MGIEGFIAFATLVAMAFYCAIRSYFAFCAGDWNKNMILGAILAGITCAIFPYAHVALEGPFMGAMFWCIVGCLFVSGRVPSGAANGAGSQARDAVL